MGANAKDYFYELNYALKGLTILRGLKKDGEVFVLLEELLDGILFEKASLMEVYDKYHLILEKILEHTLVSPFPGTSNPWQDYVLDQLFLLEAPFIFQLASEGMEKIDKSVVNGAKKDFLSLQGLFSLSGGKFEKSIKSFFAEENWSKTFPHWQFNLWGEPHTPTPRSKGSFLTPILELKLKFYERELKWDQHLVRLAKYFRDFGIGNLGCYHAFSFQDNAKDFLKPIPAPDPIKLVDLVGYERQKEQVIKNTAQFVKGFPANNLLLYGDRGTGKSSTIKALVHEFGPQGLRMVEMTKKDLKNLPLLLDAIRHRNHRFIIFIDDLSFEEDEEDYKHLKAVLEGSLEMRPAHVLIYATSNRRHLIKEKFSDRQWTGDEEVRAQDTLQEKLSLGDRFGMTITFTTPDQEQYLEIVEGLAEQAGLKIEEEMLRERALKWALWHNGPSGRTARQFVDDLIGRMGMENVN